MKRKFLPSPLLFLLYTEASLFYVGEEKLYSFSRSLYDIFFQFEEYDPSILNSTRSLVWDRGKNEDFITSP